MEKIKVLKYFANGKWEDSKTTNFMDIYDPSTGEIIAKTPCCTEEEIQLVIKHAENAFHSWSQVPVLKRMQVLYKFRSLLEENMDEIIYTISRENGKVWNEAKGEVLKVKEHIEFACSVPSLMAGSSILDASKGYDTTLYYEPVGVFAGIVPFNFPAMIPMGWIAPLCIATGNTLVLKASSLTPMTAMRLAEFWKEAGLPDGVLNVVTCSRNEAEILIKHEDIKGISFIGSTSAGQHIYSKAASYGKRVQALCEAKNHGLVLEDAPLENMAEIIINAAFGCAGERCMALPVVVVEEKIADKLVKLLAEYAGKLNIGPAYDMNSKLGPLVTDEHRQYVIKWIDKGIKEGAKIVLDGRGARVNGYEGGFYLGPTIFDHVTEQMSIGNEEIFGPVLCIKRVKNFEEGIEVINKSRFGNGSVVFTRSGYYSREFVRKTHSGMVGVNVGIPVPIGIFPFSGHKNSFFGDLHVLGKDGIRFYTETKVVTTKWISEHEGKKGEIDTWS